MQDENPYAPPASIVADPQPLTEAVHAPASALVYAGFWRRFAAFWLDALIFAPLSLLTYFVGERTRLFHLYWFVPGLLIGLWFHIYLVVRYGGTPGKLLLKMRIAMLDGTAVTQKAAVLRYSVVCVLSALSSLAIVIAALGMSDEAYLSLSRLARNQKLVELAPAWHRPIAILIQVWVWGEFVTMLLNKKRRAVHDFLAGTVILRRNTDA